MSVDKKIDASNMIQIALEKRGELFIFRYLPGTENDLIDCFARLAADKNSGFDLRDAAVLSYQCGRKMEPYLTH